MNALSFGIRLAHQLNTDLYFLALDFSAYKVIKIASTSHVFSGIETYFEDERGQEMTRIEGLTLLKKSAVDELQKDLMQVDKIEDKMLLNLS